MKKFRLAWFKSAAFRYFLLTICGLLIYGSFCEPLLWLAYAQDPMPPRRVNVSYFEDYGLDDYHLYQGAILWFGQVDNTSNYADVRLGYSENDLRLYLHIFDRRLWHDQAAVIGDLTAWDAATLYLHLDGNTGNSLSSSSYRFVGQSARDDVPAAYRGNGSGWTATSTPFSIVTGWRGSSLNSDLDDKGWWIRFLVPFSSLGLSGPPPPGTMWGLAFSVHDRDDAAGTPIPDQTWPEEMDAQRPASWGQLVFGQPSYIPPPAAPGGVVTVRHGLNGASVMDAHVGGNFTCGAGIDHWSEWGEANYATSTQINVQNQWDVADWPCFSKYYVTFPLDAVPPGKEIISATLTMTLFGNAGYNPEDARPSLIQALTVGEDWDEASVTWNNAPLAAENVASTWVYPVAMAGERSYHWDVSRAVAEAYASGDPLRLALYSADGEYHSGKYFWSSDSGDWNAEGRPTLKVLWGEAAFELSATPALQLIDAGGVATYTVNIQHSSNFTHVVNLQVEASSPPGLMVELASPTAFSPPGGHTMLTLVDSHDVSFSSPLLYTIPMTASGGGFTATTHVKLLVNGRETYLPVIFRDQN
jgi:hypothetical protein